MASRSLPLFRAALRPVIRAGPVARFAAPAARSAAVCSSRSFALSASRFKAVESESCAYACRRMLAGLRPSTLVG